MTAVLASIAAAGISGVVALAISSFHALRADLIELRSEIGELRSELRSEVGGLREEMHRGFAELRGEIARLAERRERPAG